MAAPAVFDILSNLASSLNPCDIALAATALFTGSLVAEIVTTHGGRRRPIMWPVLGILPWIFLNLNSVYDWVTSALNKCGGTFAYHGTWFAGAHGAITSDPTNIEYMLKIRFANFPKGKYYRERFAEFLGDGIFNADDEVWKVQRRAANAEMHSSRFAEYSFEIVKELVHGKLLPVVGRLVKTGGVVDLQDVFLRFTFDNICSAAFGIDPGCLTMKDEAVDAQELLREVPFARAFEQATELSLFRFIIPPFVWKPMRWLNVGTERKLKVAVKDVHKFAEKTVVDRREELLRNGHLSSRSDLLSKLVEATVDDDDPDNGTYITGAAASDQKNRFKFSNKFIKDFCISFILAGRDTSSVALAWFFWLLDHHPEVESRILDELHQIIHRRRVGTDNDNIRSIINKNDTLDANTIVFTPDELKDMEYLHAALSESLRLYPSVPADFKEALTDDVLPDGTPVRAGARVVYSIYSMARLASVWGPDCHQFRPERWLSGEGRFLSESQFKYAVFNAGPRLCVGKKFAYTQMKMLAASLLLRAHVKVVPGQKVGPKMNTTLYIKNGLLVTFEPREFNK